MQNEQLIWKTGPAVEVAILPALRPSPFLLLAEACACRRKIRIRMPLPRRPSCVTRQAMIAALREAEFANWQATGGDFLRSHQPDRIGP